MGRIPNDKDQTEPGRQPCWSLLVQPCRTRSYGLIDGLDVRVKFKCRCNVVIVIIILIEALKNTSRIHRIKLHVGIRILGVIIETLLKDPDEEIAMAILTTATIAYELAIPEGE